MLADPTTSGGRSVGLLGNSLLGIAVLPVNIDHF